MPFVKVKKSLPRSLDVQISLSRASAETRTDLSTLVVALTGLGFSPDAGRIRFYSSIEAVEVDFASGHDAHFAATSFFAQTPRPPTMALGEVFLDPISAENTSATLLESALSDIINVNDGNMIINYTDDTLKSAVLSNIDFTGALDIDSIAVIIDNALQALPNTEIECVSRTLPGGDAVLSIITSNTGDTVRMFFPTFNEGETGTYIGDLLKLTEIEGGRIFDGYAPEGISGELTNIANAANAAGKFVYGWTLGSFLRTTQHQEDAAIWALPRTAMMVLTTNDPLAVDPANTDDIGPVIAATDNRRVVVLYHDNVQRYPDVSILAYMLHVNYRLQASVVTAKFKQLPGIETVPLSETEWATLQTKGYNTYTAIGNDSRTYRDGNTSGIVGWFMDTVINLDNFLEDLSVNVFNVFLRNKKIPYTRAGQLLLVDACQDTGNQYVYNGTFANREESNITTKSKVTLIPAVLVVPTPVNQSSVSDRASRAGPPIKMIVQESGAIHSTSINVELVQ